MFNELTLAVLCWLAIGFFVALCGLALLRRNLSVGEAVTLALSMSLAGPLMAIVVIWAALMSFGPQLWVEWRE
jgi:hypothetical protein